MGKRVGDLFYFPHGRKFTWWLLKSAMSKSAWLTYATSFLVATTEFCFGQRAGDRRSRFAVRTD
jgi:hypothetical protein